jgi:hypothetical protein
MVIGLNDSARANDASPSLASVSLRRQANRDDAGMPRSRQNGQIGNLLAR